MSEQLFAPEPTASLKPLVIRLGRRLLSQRYAVVQVLAALLATSILALLPPLLTQAMIDQGIGAGDFDFVLLVAMAELMIFAGMLYVGLVQGWLLTLVCGRVGMSLLADFIGKLTRLPLRFFDFRHRGDIFQRLDDHHRVEMFLSAELFGVVFSLCSIVAYVLVLAAYSGVILGCFALGSMIYTAWMLAFLNRRRELDYQQFEQMSTQRNREMHLLDCMVEVKLSSSEIEQQHAWQRGQAELFQTRLRGLKLGMFQGQGSSAINQLVMVAISVYAAHLVITSAMTLGMMMATLQVLGALNGLFTQLVGMINSGQDAVLSLRRIADVVDLPDEDASSPRHPPAPAGDLVVRNVEFSYDGTGGYPVLRDLSLSIPEGKTTAIVGMSGSGKTTLLRLLLKFDSPQHGKIELGNLGLHEVDARLWRAQCGAVMQDGQLFASSVARNIAVIGAIEHDQLRFAAEMANALDFIEALPQGFDTPIGRDGHGLSRGQAQRIFIARAIYKRPSLLFFDEATSALDTENERIIVDNIARYLPRTTKLVIAHRMSTVRAADQILVMEAGQITEQGSHDDLVRRGGTYLNLVRNQLELAE